MNLEPFFELCQSTQWKDQRCAELFCKRLKEIGNSKNFANLDTAISLFYGEAPTLGKALFFKNKKMVISFYRWLEQEGIVTSELRSQVENLKLDDVAMSQFAIYYYKNIDDVLGYIDQLVRIRRCDPDSVLFVKSVIILTWYQVTLEEMVLIKKGDLVIDSKMVQIPCEPQKTLFLEEKYFNILLQYADLQSYESPLSQRRFVLSYSRYLFRTYRYSQMSANSVSCKIKAFNSAVCTNKELHLPEIAKNGVFYEVLKNNKSSINAEIQRITGCDKPAASGYARLYEGWKRMYYGGDAM